MAEVAPGWQALHAGGGRWYAHHMPNALRIALVCLIGLSACRSRTADLGMSDSAFVQVMGELKAVADAPNVSGTLRAQRRDAVLRKRAVTAAQLEKTAGELTAHPAHARRLWSAIEVKAQKILSVPN
jgi:hypothetical protein